MSCTPSNRYAPAASLLTVLVSVVSALTLAMASPSATAAQASQRRLQIHIDYLREAGVQQGAEQGRGRLMQTLALNALLHSDGIPMPNNPLDPDDGRRQAERAQQAQQRVQSALAKQGRPAAPTAAAVDMAAMQARAQQMQARCGSDRDCLMREAMAMSAVQVAGGNASVQSRLNAYGAAVQVCERKAPAGAARDACISNARRQAGGADDETDRDEDVETPYLFFIGKPGCQIDLATQVDDRIEGSFQDVQGSVAFTQTAQAEQRQRDDSACPLLQAVLDTRNGRLWTNGPGLAREARGVMVRSEKGRKAERSEGGVALRWHEAGDWVNRQLQNLSPRGANEVKLPAGVAGRNDGQVRVRMRWSFEAA